MFSGLGEGGPGTATADLDRDNDDDEDDDLMAAQMRNLAAHERMAPSSLNHISNKANKAMANNNNEGMKLQAVVEPDELDELSNLGSECDSDSSSESDSSGSDSDSDDDYYSRR